LGFCNISAGVAYLIMEGGTQSASATAEQQVNDLLRQRHRIANCEDNEFTVRNLADIAELANNSNQAMTLLLASIAFVSLVVGGSG
jgi:putative ABC transport system permease protein